MCHAQMFCLIPGITLSWINQLCKSEGCTYSQNTNNSYWCTISIRQVQFLLHLEPAVSIKKAQGQSLNSAGVDLKTHCFSDVQSYTACTQVQTAGQSMCTYMPLHDIPEHNVSMHTTAHLVNRYQSVCSKWTSSPIWYAKSRTMHMENVMLTLTKPIFMLNIILLTSSKTL